MTDQTPSMPPLPDRELVELAAAAAGIQGVSHWGDNPIHRGIYVGGVKYWNPLQDDGDALRLSVKLGIQLWRNTDRTVSGVGPATGFWTRLKERLEPDPYAATRRAIVRAAAEIGAANPTPSLAASERAA